MKVIQKESVRRKISYIKTKDLNLTKKKIVKEIKEKKKLH